MSTCSISRNLDDGAKCIQGIYQDSSNLWDGDVMLAHELSNLMQYN